MLLLYFKNKSSCVWGWCLFWVDVIECICVLSSLTSRARQTGSSSMTCSRSCAPPCRSDPHRTSDLEFFCVMFLFSALLSFNRTSCGRCSIRMRCRSRTWWWRLCCACFRAPPALEAFRRTHSWPSALWWKVRAFTFPMPAWSYCLCLQLELRCIMGETITSEHTAKYRHKLCRCFHLVVLIWSVIRKCVWTVDSNISIIAVAILFLSFLFWLFPVRLSCITWLLLFVHICVNKVM